MKYQRPHASLVLALDDAKEHSMFKTQYVKKVKSLGTYVVDDNPHTDMAVEPVCSYYEGIRTTYPSMTDFNWIHPGYIFNHSFRLPLDKWKGGSRG